MVNMKISSPVNRSHYNCTQCSPSAVFSESKRKPKGERAKKGWQREFAKPDDYYVVALVLVRHNDNNRFKYIKKGREKKSDVAGEDS